MISEQFLIVDYADANTLHETRNEILDLGNCKFAIN